MGRPEEWTAVFSPDEIVVLELADALSGDGSHALDSELAQRLRTAYDEEQLAELILVAGQANLNNRGGNAAKQLLGPA